MDQKTDEKHKTVIPPTASRRKRMDKLKEQINKLPDKKPHLDFLAGILTIPLLIITLILNLNNLTGKNTPTAKTSPTPVASIAPIIIYRNSAETNKNIIPLAVTTKLQPTTSQDQCIKDIGPIDISYPQEEQTVNDNPLCISINYHAGNYCSVVWAYSINHSPLSDYSNNSVCLYNLPSGKNNFTLQVKSLVSSSTQTLQRNFIYNNPSPSPTNVSPSVTPAP